MRRVPCLTGLSVCSSLLSVGGVPVISKDIKVHVHHLYRHSKKRNFSKKHVHLDKMLLNRNVFSLLTIIMICYTLQY